MDNMLGVKDVKGILVDLLAKLTGDDWETWFREVKRFLRKEPCWTRQVDTVLTRIRSAGYLDTSFEGKEFHRLEIRPLTKEEAIAEYKTSGGKTWVWDELEKNMPYTTPKAESLDVMVMNFNRNITSDDVLAEMDKLGVRPLTYEELIQYSIAHPEHQKQKVLIGLGTKHTLGGNPHAPDMRFVGGERILGADHWDGGWDDRFRFPVVRK